MFGDVNMFSVKEGREEGREEEKEIIQGKQKNVDDSLSAQLHIM